MNHRCILFVCYGCASKNQLETILLRPLEDIKEKYPMYIVDYAFTSEFMRNLLYKKENLQVDLIHQKIERLMMKGITDIIIQPILMIPGEEFLKIERCFENKIYSDMQYTIGDTLLYESDYDRFYQLIANALSKQLSEDEGVVLMGHGTKDSYQQHYIEFAGYLKKINPRLYLGTLEAIPDIDTIILQLKKDGIEKVHLLSLLIGSGSHTLRDMLGENPKSWKSRLEEAGISVVGHPEGISDYDDYLPFLFQRVEDLIKKHTCKTSSL